MAENGLRSPESRHNVQCTVCVHSIVDIYINVVVECCLYFTSILCIEDKHGKIKKTRILHGFLAITSIVFNILQTYFCLFISAYYLVSLTCCPCSGDILTLLSLYPGLLEVGLKESACIVPEDTPETSPEPSLAEPAMEVGTQQCIVLN